MPSGNTKYSRRTILKTGGAAASFGITGSALGMSTGETDTEYKSQSSQQTQSISNDNHSDPRHLVGTWTQAPQAPLDGWDLSTEGFSNQTFRSIIRSSVGGKAIRVQLANTFGDRPVTFGHVTIGVRASGAAVSGSPINVTFSGDRTVTIPVNARVYSDLVPLNVEPEQELVVSVYAPDATGPATWHLYAKHHTYTTSNDHASDIKGDAFTQAATSWFFLDSVDIFAPKMKGAVATLGDSITDGVGSTFGTDHTWPDFLANRLNEQNGVKKSVLNAGITGNRVLHNTGCCGINALARLDRDVITQTGVTDVILLEGINDIGFGFWQNSAKEDSQHSAITAEDLIKGYQQIITRVHAKGLRILGGTLMPYKRSIYYTKEGEQARKTVNRWIQNSGAFDGVVDFDQALCDPNNPKQLLPKFDSGDHLHPSDAGHRAMANAVNLSLLRRHGR